MGADVGADVEHHVSSFHEALEGVENMPFGLTAAEHEGLVEVALRNEEPASAIVHETT